MKKTIETFWQEFLLEKGIDATYTEAYGFGPTKEDQNELAELTVKGIKRATTSLCFLYEIENEIFPKIGDYNIILNGNQEPVAVIQNTDIKIVAFNYVDEAFAYREGEGDKSLFYWKEVHREVFKRYCAEVKQTFQEDMLCCLQEFEVVYK